MNDFRNADKTVNVRARYSFRHDEWQECPACGKKLFRIKQRSNEARIEIKCRNCGKILNVRI